MITKTQNLNSSLFKRIFFYQHIFLPFFLLFSYCVSSQSVDHINTGITPIEIWESGLPLIENYRSGDYKSSPQNWDFIEGDDGFLYAGNTNGVLQFDGNTWSTIDLENKSLVRSLAKTRDGTIYVGGVNELGYLKPDEIGRMQYHSLKSFISDESLEFRDIWSTEVIGNVVYFGSNKYLFRWDGKTIKTWKAQERFGYIFHVNNTLLIDRKGIGIHKIEGDSLILVPNGDLFSFIESSIDGMLPYSDNDVVMINATDGMLLFNGENTTPLNQESNAVFQKHRIYRSIVLANGDYAMATLNSGLYIVDGQTGKIKKRLGKKQGLISDVLFSVYQDRFRAIWVGSDNGISKIDWASPFRKLDEHSGLPERVRSVIYHKGKFLVDSKGLYQLAKNDAESEVNEPVFKKIEGIENTIEHILPFNDDILAFNSGLIFIMNEQNSVYFVKSHNFTLTAIAGSKIDSSKVYAGTIEGELFECTFEKNQWTEGTEPVLQIKGSIESIDELENGDLWLRTLYDGLYFAKKQSDSETESIKYELIKYDTLSGLPSMTLNFPYLFNGKIFVTAQDGMYTFNETNKRFVKDTLLNNQYSNDVDAYGFMGKSKDGRIWQTVRAGFENKIYTLSDGNLTEMQEYNLYSDFSTYSMEFLDGVILFLGPDGILAYNQNHIRPSSNDLKTNVRKVWVNNDSLVYAGFNNNEVLVLPYGENNLNFEFVLLYYDKSQNSLYQSYLEGFDKNWSLWTSETSKNYTNLPPGEYTFKVRSKNVFNEMGAENTYVFSISAPWYRTWWAYVIYGLSAAAIFWFLVKWRSNKLQKQNESLEKTISERTLEIQNKNKLLNLQTEKLVEVNESKTRLYSNISHEFRTPLTVILGMADELKSDFDHQITKNTDKSLEMIRRNGNNLLNLVNELLDLAKLESGNMELDLVQIDVVPFVKYFSESFHSLAETKKINLTVYSEIESLAMDIDVNKLGAIISNLLSNAIKFTSENGKIIVHITKIEQPENHSLQIKVQDNGQGIAEKDLLNLFDRFYQVADASYGQQVGTGIGLSITKEFVELMNGEVSVESSIGKGTTFLVQIPITNNAVIIEEIIDKEASIKMDPPEYEKELSLEEPTSDLPLLLIIEDNLDVTHYLETCLHQKYQTIHATDGEMGMQMAFEKIPDIIISDVMMPKKNGYEVCAALKADERTDHIPIILLTAKVTTDDRLTGLAHGADAYLSKPFNKAELFTRLDQLLLVRKKLISKLEKNGFSVFLKEKVDAPQTKFLQEVIKHVLSNLDNSNFGPTLLSEEMRLSESQIYRKLKSITDKSTAIFIRSVRLQKAKELLQTSNKTVSEIAYEVGFNDPSWFSRAFKEEFGFPPSSLSK